jgi:hypothetical protein
MSVVPRSFAEDRPRGSAEGSLMGPKTPTEYYIYQHGQLPPVLPPAKGFSGAPNQPFYDSRPMAPASLGHWGVSRVWVPERRQEVWIWGHFENGYWVNGHSEVLFYPGYFEEHKVWMNGSGN